MAARKSKSTKSDRTELIEALEAIEKEKQISKDIILEAIENSLVAACKNQFESKADNIRVSINRDTGEIKGVFRVYRGRGGTDGGLLRGAGEAGADP